MLDAAVGTWDGPCHCQKEVNRTLTGLDSLSGTVVWQTSTSSSDCLLCVMKIEHALLSSDTRQEISYFPPLPFHCFRWPRNITICPLPVQRNLCRKDAPSTPLHPLLCVCVCVCGPVMNVFVVVDWLIYFLLFLLFVYFDLGTVGGLIYILVSIWHKNRTRLNVLCRHSNTKLRTECGVMGLIVVQIYIYSFSL